MINNKPIKTKIKLLIVFKHWQSVQIVIAFFYLLLYIIYILLAIFFTYLHMYLFLYFYVYHIFWAYFSFSFRLLFTYNKMNWISYVSKHMWHFWDFRIFLKNINYLFHIPTRTHQMVDEPLEEIKWKKTFS